MASVCVYLGSRDGSSPLWGDVAEQVGRTIAEQGYRLVYGGGRVGLMGRCAEGALAAGGEVVGVIPDALVEREAQHTGLTELIRVTDMHTRKARMSALSDAFVALPGGIGTFEELFEIWTWSYLDYHDKPVGLLNVNGFYDTLLAFMDETVQNGFLNEQTRNSLFCDTDISSLLARMIADK